MRFTYSIFTAIVVMFALAACEKTVILDTAQTEPKIVIEGLVSDRPMRQFIRVTRSGEFYGSGETPRVTDATVYVTDDTGNRFDFFHNPNNESDSVGYYKPVDGFVGEVGRVYTMTVMVDGKVYTGQDELIRISAIDSLTYHKDLKEEKNTKVAGRFYEVLMYAKEPQETEDFYKFDFYRDDSLSLASETDIYFSDDTALDQDINGIASPIYYSKGDKARVEFFSISRGGFIFYNDLNNLLNNDGGMFSPPPANIRNGLSNGALGFFQVSAIETKEILIE